MAIDVVSYPDLLGFGISRSRVRTMVVHQAWSAIRRGVYGDVGEPCLLTRLRAADIGLGRGWVASHGTAAALHQMVLLRPPALDRLIITVQRGTAGHSDPVGVHVHRAGLPSWHTTELHGIRITTVARTLVDLARILSLREGLIAVDAALHRGTVDVGELLAVVADCRRWPGIRRAARVIELADPRCESPLESVSRLFFIAHAIPLPTSQVELIAYGRLLARVDFWWKVQRVAGEADGLTKYTKPGVLQAEKLRQEQIEQHGVPVVRWTWNDVTRPSQAPSTVRRLRRVLGLAA